MPTKSAAKKRAGSGARPRAKAKAKKGEAYTCRVCGYRLVVDRACGCGTLHTYVCCGKPMEKSAKK